MPHFDPDWMPTNGTFSGHCPDAQSPHGMDLLAEGDRSDDGTVRLMETRLVELRSGVRIGCHFSGDPSGPTMVLLHALGEQAASWAAVEPRFASLFRVVNVDLRGHGDSDWPGVYSFELMRDDVIEVIDALGLRDVVLVGHSMGGTVAYLVAQAQPARIARLVVEDVPPPFPRTRPVPERPEEALGFDWAVVPAIVEQVNDPTRRWWRHLPDITSPTLLIGGGPTSHVPQELLVEVSGLIPDCTLIAIPAGHNVHETQPNEFSDVVLQWLDDADTVS
jgi:3-oxoadipate enol-lactonase